MLFGDYVDQHPRWATFKKIDTEYGNAIKAAGGTVDWINLPDIGIKGNGHMMMQDKNNDAGRRGDPEMAGRQRVGRIDGSRTVLIAAACCSATRTCCHGEVTRASIARFRIDRDQSSRDAGMHRVVLAGGCDHD